MDERERFDGLLLLLDDLVEANRRVPILVEGKRDVASLRALGCPGVVSPLNNGRSLWAFVEATAREGSHVILLTDWDPKGAALAEQLASGLGANGVRADTTYRDRIGDLVRSKVRDVESLSGYVSRGLARFHRSTIEDRQRGLALG